MTRSASSTAPFARSLVPEPAGPPGKGPGVPSLSVIVVLYEMYREAPRTLHTLSTAYQRDIDAEYEVVVLDNGSSRRRRDDEISIFGPQFRYRYVTDPEPSPASAINAAVGDCQGELIGICYDGARMLSPGMLSLALRAATVAENPYLVTLGWHLGPDVQYRSQANGYDRAAEDRLLDAAGWQGDGYRLFEISSLAGSNPEGWFGPIWESPVQFLRRDTFARIGGFSTEFRTAAGGLLNLDFFREACEAEGTQPVVLLGEGSFHQLHGAEFNNASRRDHRSKWRAARREYRRVRGRKLAPPSPRLLYFGSIRGGVQRFATAPPSRRARMRSALRGLAGGIPS